MAGDTFRASLLKEQARDVNVTSVTFWVQIARELRKVGNRFLGERMSVPASSDWVPKRIASMACQADVFRARMEQRQCP
jgi:hypothetical protein